MGRQQYLTRLALGRSPYGDPIRDEDGNLIISPHAGIHNDVSYKQDFDERGHPRNLESEQISRRFRRAQNNVLAVTGVVQRKGEAQKSEWEKLKSKEKIGRVMRENGDGKVLKGVHRALGGLVPWPVYALRRRLVCFSLYSDLPFLSIARFEDKFVGVGRIMTAGLIPQLLAIPPQMYRHYVREPDVEDIVNYVDPSKYVLEGLEDILFRLVHLPCSIVEIPLQVFSVLQSLFIGRQDTWPPLLYFIPFSRFSPISLPLPPKFRNINMFVTYAATCARTPLVVSIVREYIHAQIGYRLYALLRQLLPKPDNPDPNSIKAFTGLEELDDTSIPGLGRAHATDDDNYVGRSFGPRSFWGAFRLAFPFLYKVINFCTFRKLSTSRGRLHVTLERSLQINIRKSYVDYLNWTAGRAQPGQFCDVYLRREIMYEEFHQVNLDPDQELVDPYAWIDMVLHTRSISSKDLTPEIARLVNFHESPWDPADYLPVSNDAGASQTVQTTTEPEPAQSLQQAETVQSHNLTADGVRDSDASARGLPEQPSGVDNTVDFLVDELERELQAGQSTDASLHGYEAETGTSNPLTDIQSGHMEDPGPQRSTTSIARIDQPIESDNPSSSGNDESSSSSSHSIFTPTPGISQAMTLNESGNPLLAELRSQIRRVRRPTETDAASPEAQLERDLEAILFASDVNPINREHNRAGPLDSDDIYQEVFEIQPLSNDDFIVTTARRNPFARDAQRAQPASRPSSPPSTSSYTSPPFSSHRGSHRHRYPYRHPNITRTPLPTSLIPRHYRTTLLSTFAADSLAWHLSSLLTNIILLPFEVYYVNCIALWFLDLVRRSSLDGDGSLAGMIDENGAIGAINEVVFGSQLNVTGFSRSGTGLFTLRYMGKMMAAFGIEALIRGGLWWWGTRSAVRKGMDIFGWGKF